MRNIDYEIRMVGRRKALTAEYGQHIVKSLRDKADEFERDLNRLLSNPEALPEESAEWMVNHLMWALANLQLSSFQRMASEWAISQTAIDSIQAQQPIDTKEHADV